MQNQNEPFRRIAGVKAITDGAQGPVVAFAIFETNGHQELGRHVWRLPESQIKDEETRRKWVPRMSGVPVNCHSYEEMIAGVAEWIKQHYNKYKGEEEIVFDVGLNEAALLKELTHRGWVDFNQQTYPFYNNASLLRALGYEPTEPERFLQEVGPRVGVHLPNNIPEPLNKAAKIAYTHAAILRELQERGVGERAYSARR